MKLSRPHVVIIALNIFILPFFLTASINDVTTTKKEKKKAPDVDRVIIIRKKTKVGRDFFFFLRQNKRNADIKRFPG